MVLLDSKPPDAIWRDSPHAPELVAVPGGRYLMGGIPEDKFVSSVELPRHPVTVTAFALGRAPVTCGEWRRLMGALPDACEPGLADDHPVVNVNFPEALGFLRELSMACACSYRLPSEAEWEYACRAGSESVFPNGGNLGSHDANFLYDERGNPVGAGHLTAVGCFPANSFGLFDMLGNVCEWTADRWHPGYHGAPGDSRAWTDGGKPTCRTIRGGAWDHLPRILRASWRDWAPESARWDNLGFRVARDL